MGVGFAAQELLLHAALYKHCASSILVKMPANSGESALLYFIIKISVMRDCVYSGSALTLWYTVSIVMHCLWNS